MKLDFKKNVGTTDKIIRASIGVLLLVFGLTEIITGWFKTLAIIFAILLFVTVIFSYCSIYDLLGKSTRKEDN